MTFAFRRARRALMLGLPIFMVLAYRRDRRALVFFHACAAFWCHQNLFGSVTRPAARVPFSSTPVS